MTEAASLVQQGVAHLNGQRAAEAATCFLGALQTEPQLEQAWLGMTLALALTGQIGDIAGLVDYRQRVIGDGFLFCHAALGMLVTYRAYPQIIAFAEAAASAYLAPASYQAGCAALLAGDEEGAFRWFARFKDIVAGQEAMLPIGPESHFNVAYRQGTLIEDRAYVAGLDSGDAIRALLPAPEFSPPRFGDHNVVLAAACDRHYFRLFAPGFVDTAAQMMPGATVHFHVIEPDEETHGFAASLQAKAPLLAINLSTEPAGPYRSGAYYACSRFLIGPALLDRYPGQRLTLLDVDVEFVAPLNDLLVPGAGYDLACFRHDGAGPCSRYPAVLTSWAPTENGRALLDRVGRFVLSKIEIKWPFNWMLDQAALASVIRWAPEGLPDAKIGFFNDFTGRHFQPWLRSVGGDEKAGLIRAASR